MATEAKVPVLSTNMSSKDEISTDGFAAQARAALVEGHVSAKAIRVAAGLDFSAPPVPVRPSVTVTEPGQEKAGLPGLPVMANELCPEHKYPPVPVPSYMLKLPPKKTAATGPQNDSGPPSVAESAVSLEFLRAFVRRLPGGGASSKVNVARMVDELVRPSTGATQASYASQQFLVPRGHTSTPTWVVVHSWDLPVTDLVAALEAFSAGLPPGQTFFWLSALALPQHGGTGASKAGAAALGLASKVGGTSGDGGADGSTPAPGSGSGSGRASAVDRAGTGASMLAPGPAPGPASVVAMKVALQQAEAAAALAGAAAAARRQLLAGVRAAVRASKCGALLLVGREARPLKRAWALVEAVEALRHGGPEAVTVLPVHKGFKRSDFVRQLREIDLDEAVLASDEVDHLVLSEALGIPQPSMAPASRTPGPDSNNPANGPDASTSGPVASLTGTPSLRKGMSFSRATSLRRSASMVAADRPPPVVAGAADGRHVGRATVRQLQLALLLRPIDGALPARALGVPLPDAAPIATNAAAAAASAAATCYAPLLPPPPPPPETAPAAFPPWAFDWLWDWSPIAAWLNLPTDHPQWPVMLLTGPHGSGKSTALACLAAATRRAAGGAPAPIVSAVHFTTATDVRTLVAGEAVRSLSYQLACRNPGFGAALVRTLLEVGGAGGGVGLVPDGWLQGLEEVVTALLRDPLEQDASERASRNEPHVTHIIVIDGLDEGPAAAAAAVGDGAAGTAAPPPPNVAGNGQYDILRLVVDHLRQLPHVRLILSCSPAPGDPASVTPTAPSTAATTTSTAVATAAPAPPFTLPWAQPVRTVGRGAGAAAGGVLTALRVALQPWEVPLAAVRREAYLALALAYGLQDFVLSPELTARELLWQARGCLAHAHLLTLLVRHAAEQLPPAAPAPGVPARAVPPPAPPPGSLEAAEAAAAAEADALAAVEAAGVLGDGKATEGGLKADDLPPRPSTPPPQEPGPPLRAQSQAEARERASSSSVPAGPPAGPEAESSAASAAGSAALRAETSSTSAAGGTKNVEAVAADGQGTVSGLAAEGSQAGPAPAAERSGASGPAAEASEAASSQAGSEPAEPPPPPPLPPPTSPPPDVVSHFTPPDSGAGGVAVHVVPPAARGSLTEEYGVLWAVRTAVLQEAAWLAMMAAALAAEEAAAAAAAAAAEASEAQAAPGSGAGTPRSTARSFTTTQTMPARKGTVSINAGGLVAPPPPPPPVVPQERAARLQLIMDAVAAAREPLDWPALVRLVQTAEAAPTTPPPSAGVTSRSVASPGRAARSFGAGGMGPVAAGLMRQPVGLGDLGPIREVESSRASTATGALPATRGGTAATGAALRLSSLGMHGVGTGTTPRGSGGGAVGSGSMRRGLASGSGSGMFEPQPMRGGEGSDEEDADWGGDDWWEDLFPAAAAAPAKAAEEMAVAAWAAVRDLEWALNEGPLAGLVWITASGKVATRHASFAEWLRRGAAASTSTAAASVGAAGGAALPSVLHPPRAVQGHAALSRILRAQMAAAESALPPPSAGGPPPPPSAVGGARSMAAATAGSLASRAALGSGGSMTAAAAAAGAHGRTAAAAAAAAEGYMPPASGYCLRNVAIHVVEGRQPVTELEAVVMDLDFWRQVLEGGHVDCLASALEQLLRTRGPDAPGPSSSAMSYSQTGGAGGGGGGSSGGAMTPRAAAALRSTGSGAPPGSGGGGGGGPPAAVSPLPLERALLLSRTAGFGGTPGSPRTSLGGNGAMYGGAGGFSYFSGGILVTPRGENHLGGGGGGGGRLRDGPRLSAAAASLIRDALRWLQTDGLRIVRRPDPTVIACSAAAAPLNSALRRRAEQLTAAAVAAGAAAGAAAVAAVASRSETPGGGAAAAGASISASTSLVRPAGLLAGAGGPKSSSNSRNPLLPLPGLPPPSAPVSAATTPFAAPANPLDPPYPPAHVTQLPHPRFWHPALRTIACPHRVTRLLPSPDGESVLASAEWSHQASVLDVHGCRRAVLCDAGADAHSSALSAAAFSADRSFLAAAGANAGTITLWDLATGTPRAQLTVAAPPEGSVGATSAAEAVATKSTVQGGGRPRSIQPSMSSVGFGLRNYTTDGGNFLDSAVPAVSVIRIHAPPPAATAGFYGAAAGTDVAAAIRPGSLLLAAGDSGSGRVTFWAIHPDGCGGVKTAELDPPPLTGSGAVTEPRTYGMGRTTGAGGAGGGRRGGGVTWLEFGHGGRSLAVLEACSTVVRVWNIQARQVTTVLRLPGSVGEVFAVRFAPQPISAPPSSLFAAPGHTTSSFGLAPASPAAPPPNPFEPHRRPPPVDLIRAPSLAAAYAPPSTPAASTAAPLTGTSPAATGPSQGQGQALGLASGPPSPIRRPPPGLAPLQMSKSMASQAPASPQGPGSPGPRAGAAETQLAIITTFSTELWALERKERVARLMLGPGRSEGGRSWAESCFAFSPAGGLLATAGALFVSGAADGAAEGGIADVDAATAALLEAAAAAVGSVDRAAATLWDARSGARVAQLRGMQGAVRSLAFTPDGSILATGAGGVIALWSATAGGACLAVLPLGEEVTEIPALAFGRGGAVLLAAAGTSVFCWDVPTAVLATAAADAAAAAAAGLPATTSRGAVGHSGSVLMRTRTSISNMSQKGALARAVAGSDGGDGGLQAGAGKGKTPELEGERNSGVSPPPPPDMPPAAASDVASIVAGHRDRVCSACFSPNGLLVLTGGADNTARMWDARRHSELSTRELPGAVLGVAWSHSGAHVAVALSNGVAIVWHASAVCTAISAGGRVPDFTQHEAARFQCSDGSMPVAGIAFSPDNNYLITVVGNGVAFVWSVKTWTKFATIVPEARAGARAGGAIARFGGLAFSKVAGKVWALLGWGWEVAMWSPDSKSEGEGPRVGPTASLVTAVAATPDGRLCAAASGTTVTIYGRGDPLATARAARSTLARGRAAVAPDGDGGDGDGGGGSGSGGGGKAASAGSGAVSAEPSGAALPDPAAPPPAEAAAAPPPAEGSAAALDGEGSAGAASAGTPAPDGERSGASGAARDTPSTPAQDLVEAAAAAGSANANAAANAAAANAARSPSPTSPPLPAPFGARITTLSAAGSDVTAVAFSADSFLIAAGTGDGSVRVWETAKWKEVGWVAGHADAVMALAWSPDGRVLLSTGADAKVLAWSTREVLVPKAGWSAL